MEGGKRDGARDGIAPLNWESESLVVVQGASKEHRTQKADLVASGMPTVARRCGLGQNGAALFSRGDQSRVRRIRAVCVGSGKRRGL